MDIFISYKYDVLIDFDSDYKYINMLVLFMLEKYKQGLVLLKLFKKDLNVYALDKY